MAASRLSADYIAYINSPEWREKRMAALAHAEHRCQVCNTSAHLDAHHRTYERFKAEKPRDLTVLCRNCHELFHGKGAWTQRSRPKKPKRKTKPKKPLKPCTICGRRTSKGRCKPCRGKSPYSHARQRYSSEVKPPAGIVPIADRGLNEPPMQRIKQGRTRS